MKTVGEISRMTGVSVRTLHHYDAIGLLKPAQVTASGYRLYDDEALLRLQNILLFRELQFSLKQIREILSNPDFDPREAIERQIRLLEIQRDRLDGIISFARTIQKTGVISMDFSAFDKTDFNRYADEAKARWGKTEAWQEYEQKNSGKSAAEMKGKGAALMDIFRELGAIRTGDPACGEAQALINKLRAFITDNFYNCTPQILRGLGQMYAAGGEMTDNIEAAGGEGTAEFVRRAIEVYAEGKK